MEAPKQLSTNNVPASGYITDSFLSEIKYDALLYEPVKNLVTPDGSRVPLCPIQSKNPHFFSENNPVKYFVLHYNVSSYGCYNFQGARIPLKNGFNIPFWRSSLRGTPHYQICDFLEFGFPLNTNQATRLRLNKH